MKKYLQLIFIILIIGCSKSSQETNSLERIYFKENWEHDGILFLTESANVERMSDDSLDLYVTKDKKSQAMDSIGYLVDEDGDAIVDFNDSSLNPMDTAYQRKIIFKNYGQVFKNNKMKIYTIYKSNNESIGRSHQFYTSVGVDIVSQVVSLYLTSASVENKLLKIPHRGIYQRCTALKTELYVRTIQEKRKSTASF